MDDPLTLHIIIHPIYKTLSSRSVSDSSVVWVRIIVTYKCGYFWTNVRNPKPLNITNGCNTVWLQVQEPLDKDITKVKIQQITTFSSHRFVFILHCNKVQDLLHPTHCRSRQRGI